MTRKPYLFFLALLSPCLGLPALAADAPVFRSDVSLVRVDAQVMDRDRRAITGLRAEDFILRDQGQVQPIRNFASESMAVDILLLLDVSTSMRPHVQRIADATQEAFRELRQGDRVGIMVFDRATRLRSPFRSNLQDVEREFRRLLREEMFDGGTDITRGLLDAADYIRREGRRDARRAIVIVTDDQTERNRDVEGVSRALARADAVLSALIAPDAMGTGRRYPGQPGSTWPGAGGGMGGPLGGVIFGRRGPYGGRGGPTMGRARTQSAGTSEIAQRSGGDSMPVDGAYALESTLQRIRQRYALHFYLPAGARAGEQRNVSVELTAAALQQHPYAEVRYRREYYVSTTPAATPAESAPTVISQTPQNEPGDAPARSRPRAVSQPGDSRDGPLVSSDAPPASAAAPAGATSGPQNPSNPAGTAGETNRSNSDSSHGHWRRVKPGEEQ